MSHQGRHLWGEAYIENYSFKYVDEQDGFFGELEVSGNFVSSTLATGILLAPDQPFGFPKDTEDCGIFSVRWEAKKEVPSQNAPNIAF